MDGMFEDMFRGPATPAPKKPEKGVAWEAKEIDGKLYVPLAQIIELLQVNDVLPAVRKGLERHL
jgi:hypothetical protein